VRSGEELMNEDEETGHVMKAAGAGMATTYIYIVISKRRNYCFPDLTKVKRYDRRLNVEAVKSLFSEETALQHKTSWIMKKKKKKRRRKEKKEGEEEKEEKKKK